MRILFKDFFKTVSVFLLIFTLFLSSAIPLQANKISPANQPVQSATEPNKSAAQTAGTKFRFEENRGQFDRRIRYHFQGRGFNLFLTATEAPFMFCLSKTAKINNSHSE